MLIPLSICATGEVYPDRVWRGLGYEYQGEWIKEYEFNLITTSENILRKSSFNEGNPIQSKPTTAKLTKEVKTKSLDKIEVDDTSLFLSSGYLMIPKWIRKTENYLELGVEGVNKIVNDRNHYYYDGEEIIYYTSRIIHLLKVLKDRSLIPVICLKHHQNLSQKRWSGK